MTITRHYDVIIIGGGHAGCEAASASARLGVSTLLLTQKLQDIGTLSCNPAIGGLARGHLVREVDALGGIMGRCIDKAGIHFRMLNRSRGPAVQSPRAQADRELYQKAALELLSHQENLDIVADKVMAFERHNDRWTIQTKSQSFNANAVVLTTGTFLNGVIHFGETSRSAGRIGDEASTGLARDLANLSLSMARLKTGTPPRIRKSSIDYSQLAIQRPDEAPVPFSYMTDRIAQPQVPCHLTYTNADTHQLIADNLHRSAMYSGNITGTPTRYCPSIEDKIDRFADRERHQIFLEPEGYHSDLVYPNGISNSLPEDIQVQFVRTVAGLENAEIIQPGYAVEYDHVDPRNLDAKLELHAYPCLFLAGQVNGTTGYEEAAAQGIVAGFNAALRSKGQAAFILSRTDALIGVLIDDLITQGVSEPYRMFTSRAEFRLILRADNADLRLTERASALGAVSDARLRKMECRRHHIESMNSSLVEFKIPLRTADLQTDTDRVELDFEKCGLKFDQSSYEYLHTEDLYKHHTRRLEREIKAIRAEESRVLPTDMDPFTISGLSNEIREKLRASKPSTLAEASRISGMTPSALARLYHYTKSIDEVA